MSSSGGMGVAGNLGFSENREPVNSKTNGSLNSLHKQLLGLDVGISESVPIVLRSGERVLT